MWKVAGPACGQRLIGDFRDKQGLRYVGFKDAVERIATVAHKWSPFDGPPATPEFLDALVRAGLTFGTHHRDWARKSGVSDKSGVCREHKGL
eukprot:12406222-Karenia_brevis.AAC.1